MVRDIDWIAKHIGSTPMLDVTPPGFPSKVLAKAEYRNLTGSVKDRAAFAMIREGLKSGMLSGSRRILEATSGNTGIGLAVVGKLLGFQTTLVMPPQVSRDRKEILRSAGAEIIYSDASAGSNDALMKALALFEEKPDAWFWPNQYYNPANYLSHRATAEEIYENTAWPSDSGKPWRGAWSCSDGRPSSTACTARPRDTARRTAMRGLQMDIPLMISAILEHAARFHGSTEVVAREIDGAIVRYTYRDAHRRAKQLAQALIRLGVGFGDRVATLAWNTHRHFEMFYGVSGTGAVLHTVNPRLFREQLVYIINHCEDTWLFCDLETLPLV